MTPETAEDILNRHMSKVHTNGVLTLREAMLNFGKEIASLAWEAGRTFGEEWQQKETEYRVITSPYFSEFIKGLFP